MKALLSAAAVVAAALLGGCATPQMNAADLDGRVVCDEVRMSSVEQTAKKDMAQVRWVNCPTATIRVVKG
jgi:hypothetical protein